MRKTILLVAMLAVLGTAAHAHFQMILPSTDIVTAEGRKTVNLQVVFTHPMEMGPVMEMAEPRQFGVLVGGLQSPLGLQAVPRAGARG